ncbi:MAG: glutamyl-tRNA reductase [Acidobacteriota bacterium]
MNVYLIGANHTSAPIELRERLFVPKSALPEALDELKRVEGVQEGLLLSTCNRTEVLTRLDQTADGEEPILDYLSRRHSLPVQELEPHLYRMRDLDAVRHMFRVAGSLDSLVLGESQILGQVKEAYLASLERRSLGRVLGGLMRHAFSVAKKIRTQTGIARNPVSISQVAVSLAVQIFGSLSGKTVMLLGAGKMGELAARRLTEEGVRTVIVSSRTLERAREIARRFGGSAVSFDEVVNHFEFVDILISSTGAPHYVLRADQVADLMRRRRNRPVFLIDIAFPRDIDPRVNEFDNVYLYDIDDLKHIVDATRLERQHEAATAESLVEREVAAFSNWYNGLQVGPLIAGMRERSEQVKNEQLERFLARHPDLSARQRQDLETLLRSLVNKILHEPTVRLKQVFAQLEDPHHIDVVRNLFEPGEKIPIRTPDAGSDRREES